MPPTIKWYGRQVTAEMAAAAGKGLRKAADYSRTLVVRKISLSARMGGGGVRYPRKGAGPPMRFQHSKPGQPPRSDTGKYKQSIFSDTDTAKLVASVGTTSKVGVYMEKGTKPHDIVRKRKKSLVFPFRGVWAFAQRVRHPGTKPRPHLWKTIQDNKERLRAIVLGQLRGFPGRGSVRFGVKKG